MKNRLQDLTDNLMAAIERLNDEDLTAEQVAVEAERGKAISGLAGRFLEGGKLALEAAKFAHEAGVYASGRAAADARAP